MLYNLSSLPLFLHLSLGFLIRARMSPEKPGRSELAEFMTHQVIHGKGQADHLGDNRRSTGVGFDHFAISRLFHLEDLFIELLLDKRSLLN